MDAHSFVWNESIFVYKQNMLARRNEMNLILGRNTREYMPHQSTQVDNVAKRTPTHWRCDFISDCIDNRPAHFCIRWNRNTKKKDLNELLLSPATLKRCQNGKFVNLNSAAAHSTDSFISFIKHQVKHLNRYTLSV